MSKVSTIVPVFNAQAHLAACLSSIREQTHTNWECICVDDGSSDDSASILEYFVETDPRFRLVRQANGGPGAARNAGIGLARGDFFTFVDADDVIHPQMLECLLRGALDYDADLVATQLQPLMHPHVMENLHLVTVLQTALKFTQPLLPLLLDEGKHFAGPVGKLYRQAVYGQLRFPRLFAAEDTCVLAEVYLRARRLVLIGEPLYYWRRVPGSLMRSGYKTYMNYIAGHAEVAISYDRICRSANCEARTRLRLVRTIGTAGIFTYLFAALNDHALTADNKKACLAQARQAIRKVCVSSPLAWRALPVKYWVLYPFLGLWNWTFPVVLICIMRRISHRLHRCLSSR